MATSAFLLFAAAVTILLSPAARALTCSNQTFPNNTKYERCLDLPVLKAFLHWTYDPTAKPKPTLSIAFGAASPIPGGWVSWGPNPTGDGMVGAQAFIAFKDSNGAITVKTYNMSEYDVLTEGKIAYDVVEKSGLFAGGMIWIFAKLAVSEWPAEVNYVWQVGSEVKNGFPVRHSFLPENLSARAKLSLPSNTPSPSPIPTTPPTSTPSPSPPPLPSSTPASPPDSTKKPNAGPRVGAGCIWLYGISVLNGAIIFGF